MKNQVLCFAASLMFSVGAWAQSRINITFSATEGIAPQAILHYPNGTQKLINQAGLVDLPQKGQYRLSAVPKRKANPIADELYSFKDIVIHTTGADSTYQARGVYSRHQSTGMLFVPNRANEILGFHWQDLQNGNAEPQVKITTPTEVLLLAADTLGNLWYWDNESLNKINFGDVATGQARIALKAPVPVAYNALFNSNAMRIDRLNRLWMSLSVENKVVVIDLAKISNGKAAEPVTTLQLELSPSDLALSADLSQLALSTVGGFAVYELPKPLPAGVVSLSPRTRSIEIGSFAAVDFDANGHLWASSQNGGLFSFSPRTLSAGEIRTGQEDQEIGTPDYIYWGILFDNSNKLWAMPRWEDGSGIDLFDPQKVSNSEPEQRYSFARNVEHGKFVLVMPRR